MSLECGGLPLLWTVGARPHFGFGGLPPGFAERGLIDRAGVSFHRPIYPGGGVQSRPYKPKDSPYSSSVQSGLTRMNFVSRPLRRTKTSTSAFFSAFSFP